MKKIFEEGNIGNLRLKNRVIMASLTTNLSHDNGAISHRDLAFYKERIDGGVGAIITGMMRVDDFYGNKFPYQPSASHTKYIKGMKMLTHLAHASDVKVFAQLNHPGAQTFRELNHELQQISASPRRPELINQKSRAMTNYEINQMVNQFVRAAIICEGGGFDGVEIHAGHGYLLHSFLAEGELGIRIIKEIVRLIDAETADDFAIILRLNFDDFVEGGMGIDDAIGIIKALEDEPIDALDVTCGVYESMYTICDAKYYPNRWKDEYISKIKDATKLCIIADNNIKYPAEAEEMLTEDIVDFVGIGRPLLADPAWVGKAKSREPIAPCISCSHCFKSINEFKPVQCPINPLLSRESLGGMTYNKANEDKTMVIIGAGPAGLQLAISLREKGYDVVVFEKADRVGGKLNIASKTAHKYRIADYVAYLERKVDELGITIRLNTVADVDEILKLNPYQVFIASGSNSVVGENTEILTAEEILSQDLDLIHQNILIIGAGENGLELAEALDESNTITIAEATNMIGREMEYGERLMLVEKLAEKNVKVLLDTRVRLGDGKEVILEGLEGSETMGFDTIISTIRPQTDLRSNSEYFEKLNNPIILGDADKIGKIYDATSKAVEIALRY